MRQRIKDETARKEKEYKLALSQGCPPDALSKFERNKARQTVRKAATADAEVRCFV